MFDLLNILLKTDLVSIQTTKPTLMKIRLTQINGKTSNQQEINYS